MAHRNPRHHGCDEGSRSRMGRNPLAGHHDFRAALPAPVGNAKASRAFPKIPTRAGEGRGGPEGRGSSDSSIPRTTAERAVCRTEGWQADDRRSKIGLHAPRWTRNSLPETRSLARVLGDHTDQPGVLAAHRGGRERRHRFCSTNLRAGGGVPRRPPLLVPSEAEREVHGAAGFRATVQGGEAGTDSPRNGTHPPPSSSVSARRPGRRSVPTSRTMWCRYLQDRDGARPAHAGTGQCSAGAGGVLPPRSESLREEAVNAGRGRHETLGGLWGEGIRFDRRNKQISPPSAKRSGARTLRSPSASGIACRCRSSGHAEEPPRQPPDRGSHR